MKSVNFKKYAIVWLLVLAVISYNLILLFPQVFFNGKCRYKHFTVYYHTSEADEVELKSVIDKAEDLLKETELSEIEYHQKVFICKGFIEYAFFARGAAKTFGVNYTHHKNVFISKSAIPVNLVYNMTDENNVRTLSSVIAHEAVHSLLMRRLGLIKYVFFPTWKNDGYCEFIARESSYNQEKGLAEVCSNNENSDSKSFMYFKYRLYIKYLLEEKKITLDNFLNADFDQKELDEGIKKKYCTLQAE